MEKEGIKEGREEEEEARKRKGREEESLQILVVYAYGICVFTLKKRF